MTGTGGVELGYDDLLAGTDGTRTYQRDVQGREISTAESTETAPVAGSDIRLTLDRDLQWYAQETLARAVRNAKAESGTVVVMTPQGEILALAAYPTFDPNDPGDANQDDVGNRAVSDVFEPGSTSKVMTAAAVIEEGGLKPTSPITVPAGPAPGRQGLPRPQPAPDRAPDVRRCRGQVEQHRDDQGGRDDRADDAVRLPEEVRHRRPHRGRSARREPRHPASPRGLVGLAVLHDRLRPGSLAQRGPGRLGLRDDRQRRGPRAAVDRGRHHRAGRDLHPGCGPRRRRGS